LCLNLAGRDFIMAMRDEAAKYPVDPTNITARLTINDGCALTASAFIMGNGGSVPGGGMTSIIHQVGGSVTSTGSTAEGNGFRMGHYPQAWTEYHLSRIKKRVPVSERALFLFQSFQPL